MRRRDEGQHKQILFQFLNCLKPKMELLLPGVHVTKHFAACVNASRDQEGTQPYGGHSQMPSQRPTFSLQTTRDRMAPANQIVSIVS